MRLIQRAILIPAIIIIAVIGIGDECLTAVTDRTVSVTGQGTKPLTPGPLLDDFRGAGVNVWGGITGTFSKETSVPPPSDAICTASLEDNPAIVYGGTGYSLKLDYNINRLDTYAGYYSSLGGASLSGYTSVSFWVRGAVGGEFFKVELKNNSTDGDHNRAAVYITDYLDGGVTTSWQQVTIPFHNFVNITDWTSMKEFVIVFENYQSTTNGSPLQGTIYIDNIQFNTTSINVVRIDHYGDKLGICALGGNIGDMPNSGNDPIPTKPWAKYSFPNTQYYNSPNGFLSEYDVTVSPGWAGHYFVFGGGNIDTDPDPDNSNAGWKAFPHNFSEYTYATLWVKAKSSTGNPKIVKVEFVDNDGASIVLLDTITTDWQKYIIPLNLVSGLDETRIKQINIVYEKSRIQNAGGNTVGGLYIDDFQFEK